jgi:hypothetical protein
MFFFVDLALWFNQYVNPIALEAIGWRYYIVYTVWIAFELFVVWKWFIETKNTALEEIAKFFDGENAMIGGGAATLKARQLQGEDIDVALPTDTSKGPIVEHASTVTPAHSAPVEMKTMQSENKV